VLDVSDIEDFVLRTNIARFRHRISGEADTKARRLLEGLLAAEEERLREITANGGADPAGDQDGPGSARS
jgi:hypothetical protein